MIEKILERLESDNSRLKKEAVLKDYLYNEAVICLMILTFHPFLRFKITLKEDELKVSGTKKVEDSWEEFSNMMENLANQTGVTDDDKRKVVQFLEQHTPKSAELYRRVINKDLRCGVSKQTVKKIFGNIVPEFSVQLADKYNGTQNGKWYASPKMDGARAIALRNPDGWVLYSRNGKEWTTVPHINKELEKLDKLGITLCDGELYSNEFPFEKIQSALRSLKIKGPQVHLIKYFIFWAGEKNDFVYKKKVSTEYGLSKLRKISQERNLSKIEVVPQYLIDLNKESADKWNKKFVDEGFEGVIFRHSEIGYEYGRGPELLKYKKFLEEDFECVGFNEGTGKNKGSLGAIIVDCGTYVGLDGLTVQVGSGFSDEMRNEIWENKGLYKGKMAEIKFQELSIYGIPRFPIFQKWKLDR